MRKSRLEMAMANMAFERDAPKFREHHTQFAFFT